MIRTGPQIASICSLTVTVAVGVYKLEGRGLNNTHAHIIKFYSIINDVIEEVISYVMFPVRYTLA